MLWSAVSTTSNFAAALWRRTPFLRPVQPICATLLTSWPTSSSLRGRGRDSSRRTRTSGQQVLRDFQRGNGLLSGHGREVIEELFQAIAGGKVVQQVLDWDASAHKHRRSPEDLGVAPHD